MKNWRTSLRYVCPNPQSAIGNPQSPFAAPLARRANCGILCQLWREAKGRFVLKRFQYVPLLIALAIVVTCMISWATDATHPTPAGSPTPAVSPSATPTSPSPAPPTPTPTPTPTPAPAPTPTGTPAAPATPLPTIFRAEFVDYVSFGYWTGDPFDSDWVETRQAPFRPGRYFGWRLRLHEPHPPHVKIIERVTSPGAPATWGGLEERHLVTNDRRTATKPTDLKVRDHWIQRANWQMNPGDVLGRYVIEIEVEGKLAARIAFDIVAERPTPAHTPEPNNELEDEEPDDADTPATPGGPRSPTPNQTSPGPGRTPLETLR